MAGLPVAEIRRKPKVNEPLFCLQRSALRQLPHLHYTIGPTVVFGHGPRKEKAFSANEKQLKWGLLPWLDGDDSTIFLCVNLKIVWYKLPAMATVGDLVLIYHEEQPAFFARIEDILADRKPDWYQVRLLVLQVPLRETVWKLREEYINGEAFTMSGDTIRMQKITGVDPGGPERESADRTLKEKHGGVSDKVISIFDRKRE